MASCSGKEIRDKDTGAFHIRPSPLFCSMSLSLKMQYRTLLLLVAVLGACADGASLLEPQGGSRHGASVRIIDGSDAKAGEFPYQVSMRQYNIFSWYLKQHLCGGTIIDKGWVLTAAHCVRAVPSSFYGVDVVAGKLHLHYTDNTEQTIGVAHMYVHEKYGDKPHVGGYDIALLKLKKDFKFNDYVQPAILPVANAIPSGSAMLTGWGSTITGNGVVLAENLQKVSLPIVNYNKCYSFIGEQSQKDGDSNPLVDSNICAGSITKIVASGCKGDSGGPFVQKSSSGNVLVGVVSWGQFPCDTEVYPSIFTRVSAYIPWINEKMQN